MAVLIRAALCQKVYFLRKILDYNSHFWLKFECNSTKKLWTEIRTALFDLRRYGIRSTYDLLQVHTSNTYFKYILQPSIRNKSYILQVPTSNTYFKYLLEVGQNLESWHDLIPSTYSNDFWAELNFRSRSLKFRLRLQKPRSFGASELRKSYGGSFWRSLNFLSKSVVSWGIVPIDSNKQQKQNIKNNK